MKKNINRITFIAVSMLCLVWFGGCRKTKIDTMTTSDLNIYPYLKENSTEFSEWAKIVEKSGYAGFLTAYGSYTMFAPTNAAVGLYLTDVGKASVDAFTVAEAKDIVKLHLMQGRKTIVDNFLIN